MLRISLSKLLSVSSSPFFSLSIGKMHRQSLGSPNSKQHHIGAKDDDLITPDEQKQMRNVQTTILAGAGADEVRKLEKPEKSTERLVHLIPMLIIFCFLILYLSSHDPSQKAIEKRDVLTIRSLRNLRELDRQSQKKHLHRKIGDF